MKKIMVLVVAGLFLNVSAFAANGMQKVPCPQVNTDDAAKTTPAGNSDDAEDDAQVVKPKSGDVR